MPGVVCPRQHANQANLFGSHDLTRLLVPGVASLCKGIKGIKAIITFRSQDWPPCPMSGVASLCKGVKSAKGAITFGSQD